MVDVSDAEGEFGGMDCSDCFLVFRETDSSVSNVRVSPGGNDITKARLCCVKSRNSALPEFRHFPVSSVFSEISENFSSF